MPEGRTTRRRLLAATAASTAGPVAPGSAAATRPGTAAFRPSLFRSFFVGGFECSTHRRADGRRLDMIAATRHDALAAQDYRQLAEHGIQAARDGVRWHLVEAATPGRYDWSSVLPMVRAAGAAGTQVAWDLCHYGWPDGLDVFSAAFVDRLARYAAAFARLHLAETGRPPVVCPVNEISFFAWAGGDMARMNPLGRGRGQELKRQLARAAIAATHAVRDAAPGARMLAIDPIIRVVPREGQDPGPAASYTNAQFEGWDMLSGRLEPGLGGGPGLLDVVGVNYYWDNQWEHGGGPLPFSDPRRRPVGELVAAVHERYGRPVFVAETSIEGDARASWLRRVCEELRAAVRAGLPLEGVCLYPVLSHPGWDDERYCANGLFEMGPHRGGRRPVHAPLAAELRRQRRSFRGLFAGAAAP